MKLKHIFVNPKNLLIFTLLLVFVFKIDFPRKFYNLISLNYDQRLNKIYGYCSNYSAGFINDIYNRYDFDQLPEIIKYTGVSGNTLTGISRAIDAGIDDRRKSDHKGKSYVYKYEFNGVSLRKINKRHDIDPREKTFNSYHVKVSTDSTNPSFNTTKSGGGNDVRVTQNIPFEAIDPQITSITPTGTGISARIVVGGSADMVANNIALMLNLADWMVQDEGLIEIRAKAIHHRPLLTQGYDLTLWNCILKFYEQL